MKMGQPFIGDLGTIQVEVSKVGHFREGRQSRACHGRQFQVKVHHVGQTLKLGQASVGDLGASEVKFYEIGTVLQQCQLFVRDFRIETKA